MKERPTKRFLLPLVWPKKKKIKHLIVYNTVVDGLKYKIENKIKINNAYIRRLLEPFNKSF